MAEGAGRKEEEKFEFTPQGEALGYISLEQARVVAMQTARDEPGNYGNRFSGTQMVFEVVEQDEGDDYYIITMSFRPAGDFTGVPGQEQFFIEKEGAVAVRQMLSLPRSEGGRRLPIVPIIAGLAVVAIVGVGGAVFVVGGLGGGGDSEIPAVLAPTATPPAATASPIPTPTVVPGIIAATATRTPTPEPTPTPVIVQREVVVTATPGPTPVPTRTPTPVPTPTPAIVQREVQVVVTATPAPTAAPAATLAVPVATVAPAPTATPRPRPTKTPVPVSTVGGIRGGHINMAALYELRPSWVHADVTLTPFITPLFNSILQYDHNTDDLFDIVCDLCTSWELAEDGLTYTFRFPRGIWWHDGVPFTAADLDTTIISMVDPFQFKLWEENRRSTSGWVGLRNYYEDHLAVDDTTLVIQSAFPAPALPVSLADVTAVVLSNHDVVNEVPQMGAQWELLNGTGPYRVGVHEPDVKTEYLRNENYFKDGLPYVDSMTQFVIIEPSTVMAAFETGQVLTTHQAGSNLSPVEKQQLMERMRGQLGGFFGPYSSPRGIVMFGRPPFDDQRVRRAIYLAIHRQPIIEMLAPDAAMGPIPFGFPWSFTRQEIAQMPGFRELNGEKHPDDIAQAKRLMAEAGYPDGFRFELSYRQLAEYGDIAVLVAEQLRDFLNIDTEIKSWESTAGYDCYNVQCTQAASQSIGMNILDADGAMDAYRSGRFLHNWTQLVMPETDEFFFVQQRELDPDKRKALVQEWAYLHMQNPNYANIWWNAELWIYNTQIQNFHGTPGHWEHIWCDPSC